MFELDNISVVTQPEGLKVNLFQHQLASIYNMENLEREKIVYKNDLIIETKLGINSDIAGYGKTYSMLGMILRDKMEWDIQIPYVIEENITEANGLITKRKIKRYQKLPTTLILVSSTIIEQWKIALLNSTLKFFCLIAKKDIENINFSDFDVILVIPSMYNNLIKSTHNNAWKRFIFDEPGHLRVSGMKDIISGFYWFVTSTPSAIITNHQSCRGSMIQKIISNIGIKTIEEYFGSIIIKNNEDFVKKSFTMPEITYKKYYCFQSIFSILNDMVNPEISKMIEADNISNAIIALGGTKTSNIIDIVKNKKHNELKNITKKIKTTKNKDNLISLEKEKIRLEHEIKLIDERFENMLKNPCSICMETITNCVMEPNCHNLFCGKCLLKWLKTHNSCPICRKEVLFSNLIYFDKALDNKKENIIPLTKPQQIVEIIKDNFTKNKFLIFSDYEESFTSIHNILNEYKIPFVLLSGDTKTKTNKIYAYKKESVNVIFINSTTDCAGINLEETTDIILFHEMSKNTKEQIIARAQRIGSTQKLTVHELLVFK